MAFVLRFAKTVRNNWKKSLFGVTAVYYGHSYAKEKYDINQLMRACCKEAAEYGNVTAPITVPLLKVTVIINPAANRRASEESFTNYCEPILFVAGVAVDIVKTDSEGHARRYIEELQVLPDALIIAGGDGTLSEVITGLLRRNANDLCPVAVIPVGRTNSVANNFYASNMCPASSLEEVKGITNAAMAVVRGKVQKKDVMKIEIIPAAGETALKPVYAMGSLQWGAFRDILVKRDKYWFTNGLRQYATFLFNSFSDDATWNCGATLTYTDPCEGCKNCYNAHQSSVAKVQSKRWWSKFLPTFQLGIAAHGTDRSKVVNETCAKQIQTHVNPSELLVITDNIEQDGNDEEPSHRIPKLHVKLGKEDYYGFGFMSDSWKRVNHPNQMDVAPAFTARTLEILPDSLRVTEEKTEGEEQTEGEEAKQQEAPTPAVESFFSIDNEAFEMKPVRISLLPKAVPMYIL